MIISFNGTLSIFAAYANLLTIAGFLGIGVNTTKAYANHPLVKLVLLYVFAYSVINDKLACLFAVAMFTVIEVREFVTGDIAEVRDLVTESREDIAESADTDDVADPYSARTQHNDDDDDDDKSEENLL